MCCPHGLHHQRTTSFIPEAYHQLMTFAGQGAPLPPPPPPTDAAVGFTSASSVSSDGIIGKAMLEENLSSEMGGVISVQDNSVCMPITRSTVILLQLFWVSSSS
jgi:hypothetical protein